jgi:RHS repeat-associated protein
MRQFTILGSKCDTARTVSFKYARSAGASLDGAAYAVDNAGNRTSKTDELASVTSNYTYDPIYELTQVTQSASTTESYSYDAVGNRTASLGVSSYTNNSSNELTATSSTSYTYDYNGNTLTKVVGSNTTSYAWDFENRLTSVTLPGSSGTISFKYDPFGRRIYKSSSSATSIYAYDGDNLIEETNSSGTAVARYSQTQNIDEPLAMLRSSTTSYFHADGLGSITSLSNASGSQVQTYQYDSFGKQTASTGSLTNPFQYTARESDTETGLYYYRARYYDPNSGKFLNEDPNDQGSQYDNPNLYEYVENNPANWIDPLGLYTLDPHQKIPPLPPSPEIDKLLKCIESKTGLNLVVTSTSENTPVHPPGKPHRRGVAVDLKYDPGNADKILCTAAGCGAGFGLDEAKHPSPNSQGNHIHLQIPLGPPKMGGGHGDIPQNGCSGGCK